MMQSAFTCVVAWGSDQSHSVLKLPVKDSFCDGESRSYRSPDGVVGMLVDVDMLPFQIINVHPVNTIHVFHVFRSV